MTEKRTRKPATISTPFRIPPAVQFATLIALVVGFLFISKYLAVILFSCLIAFIFNPVYKALLRKTRRKSIAAPSTLLIAALSTLIPLTLIVALTVSQIGSMVDRFSGGSVSVGPAQIQEVVDRGAERVNSILTAIPGGAQIEIDKEKLASSLQDAAVQATKAVGNFLKGLGTAFFGFISMFILAIFLILGLWTNQDELLERLKKLSPFDDSINNVYLHKASVMTKAMVKGQFLIALAQGFAGAFSLWIVGLDYFWFFFVLLSFLSFIPLGGGILTIPIGIIMALSGNWLQGIFIIAWHMVVVSTVDNILRPILVPKAARLNSALMLLSVFSGLAFFGTIGVILGPVVMILIVTTFAIYSQFNGRVTRISLPKTKPAD